MTPELVSDRQGPPAVSVIIAYFNDPEGLDAVLGGLRQQTYPGSFQVIVTDDGSTIPPPVVHGAEGPGGTEVVVVHQADRGFRLAAARNLGAQVATGEVLVFLDGDTVPCPGYLSAVTEALETAPKSVVVGTRTHLDMDVEPPRDLGEPGWLAEAWLTTDHLRGGDETNFRFMIGAVLSCRREVFETIGGFDGSIVGYGGEDWEFAWQAHLGGFDLRHEPQAVATHRGADWGARNRADPVEAILQKNAETTRLSPKITHPTMRAAGVLHAVPDIHVLWIPGDGERRWRAGVTAVVLTSLLAAGDVRVQLVTQENLDLFEADPRVEIHHDLPGAGNRAQAGRSRARPRFRVELLAPCQIPAGGLQSVCEQIATSGSCADVVNARGKLLCRVRPERAVAQGRTGLNRVVRAWSVIQEDISLEDEFRRSGLARLKQ
ncbi:glycosyltransferase family 2 protein [Kocuria coralli]|uniref:glycosyltransferase family 2 protein n=1 Tax=Kocuria coralli TaxID=1461025 RepID=UPI0015F2B35E|nr:glycosyltransferase [Kocuria coralli]